MSPSFPKADIVSPALWDFLELDGGARRLPSMLDGIVSLILRDCELGAGAGDNK